MIGKGKEAGGGEIFRRKVSNLKTLDRQNLAPLIQIEAVGNKFSEAKTLSFCGSTTSKTGCCKLTIKISYRGE